jgi:negative regulator of flagellin synthesis FlgM
MAIDLKNIDLAGTASSSTRKANTAPAVAPRSAEKDAPQQAGSEVSITSTASLLARLQNALASQPAVDQKRVAEISQAISNGTYKVSSSSIADGLIHSERALGKLKEI